MDRILVIEDDPAILIGLTKNLRFEGYDVVTERDGEDGLSAATESSLALIILDLMLPRVNGYELLRSIRAQKIDTPVIILTARGQEIDKIMGFNLGCDDYIIKPFSLPELLARIKAVLRRRAKRGEGEATSAILGDLVLDFEGETVRRGAEEIEMTGREFALLRYMLDERGRVLTRKEILNRVWGYDYYGTTRTVDNFINHLRQKIEEDPNEPQLILTVRGRGYKLAQDRADDDEQ